MFFKIGVLKDLANFKGKHWFLNSCFPEQFLFTVNPSKLSIRLAFFSIALFLDSFFSEQLFFITAT